MHTRIFSSDMLLTNRLRAFGGLSDYDTLVTRYHNPLLPPAGWLLQRCSCCLLPATQLIGCDESTIQKL
jgi:hypothetical protein